MSLKILMTGATGWVGSHWLDHLSNRGYDITVAGRHAPPSGGRVKFVQDDLLNPTADPDFTGTDVFIHNAGLVAKGVTPEEVEMLRAVNAEASSRLFSKAVAAGVKCIIYTSSFSLLARPLPERITEESPVLPAGPYAESKFAAEQSLFGLPLGKDQKAYVFRISSPVSPLDMHLPTNVLGKWIRSAHHGLPITCFGSGNRTQDFVHVEDIANASVQIMHSEAPSGIYHVASGNSLSMRRLAEMIASRFGVTVRSEGEDPLDHERWEISIEKAQGAFGYKPVFRSESAVADLLSHIRS